MSEILKFVVENFPKLRVLDFGLIIAIVAILAFGIYKLISGLFEKRHEAQNDLIRLKEDSISSYQRQLEVIEAEKKRFEDVANQRAKEIESLHQHLLASAIQQKFSQEHTNSIVRNTYAYRILLIRQQQLMAAMVMSGELKMMFAVYVSGQAERRFADLVKEEYASNEIQAIDDAILALCQQVNGMIEGISTNPAEPIALNDQGIDSAVDVLRGRMEGLRRPFFEAFRRLIPGIGEGTT